MRFTAKIKSIRILYGRTMGDNGRLRLYSLLPSVFCNGEKLLPIGTGIRKQTVIDQKELKCQER